MLSTTLLILVPQLAVAGANAGGTLILHASPSLVYTNDMQNPCGQAGLDSCSAAVTSVAWDPGHTIVFYAIAAFPPGSQPRMKGVSFGINYDPDKFHLVEYHTCADFDIPDGGWPGPGIGVGESWNDTQTDRLRDVYWFAGYAYSEANPDSTSFALIPRSADGGIFVDDAAPRMADSVAAYGRLGFGMAGSIPCPQTSQGEDGGGGRGGTPDDPEHFDPSTLIAWIDATHLRLSEQAGSVAVRDLRTSIGSQASPTVVSTFSAAGVTRVRRLVPHFNPNVVDRHGRPVLYPDGRPVTLPHDMSRWFVLELNGPNAKSACAKLRTSALLKHVEFNALYKLCSAPNDSLFAPEQWGLNNTGQYCGTPGFDIRALPAWEQFGNTPSYGSMVGVMDSGLGIWPSGAFGMGHEDLHAWTSGYNAFDPTSLPIDSTTVSHGTACAGIIAMAGNNGIGGAAPAWDVTIVPVKVFCPNSGMTETSFQDGLGYLTDHGVKVVNMSFHLWDDKKLQSEWEAIQNARVAGTAIAASAGNSNVPGRLHYPSAYRKNVIAVNAFMPDGSVWNDTGTCCNLTPDSIGASQCGDWIDMTAPGGRGIATTRSMYTGAKYWDLSSVSPQSCPVDWAHCYTDFSGTSAAAPFVSGVLGAILSKNNDMDGCDAEQVMLRTAVDHVQYGARWDPQSGWGHPNLAAALGRVVSKKVEHQIVTGAASNWLDGTGFVALTDFPFFPDNSGGFSFQRYAFEYTTSLDSTYSVPPDAWGRALGSSGFRRIENGDSLCYADEEPYSTEIMGVTTTSITLRSYVYHFHSSWDDRWTWFPSQTLPWFSFTALEHGSGSGVDEAAMRPAMSLVPNPTGSDLRLDLGVSGATTTVDVMDAGGRHVVSLPLDERGRGQWNLRDTAGRRVSAGVYFLHGHGVTDNHRGKIIVVR